MKPNIRVWRSRLVFLDCTWYAQVDFGARPFNKRVCGAYGGTMIEAAQAAYKQYELRQ